MPLLPYLDHQPSVAPGVFIAPDAYVVGRVTIGDRSSVWFGATARGDIESVVIGQGCNLQEHALLHTDIGYPTILGNFVSLGHHAIVHGATLEDYVLVAMSATVLTGARIGTGSIVAANALVPEGREIPPRSLVVGTPGKVVREITPAEYERIVETATAYMRLAAEYRTGRRQEG